eukprot:gene5823-11126_t
MVISEEKTESRNGKPLEPENPDPTSTEEEDFELSSTERLGTSFELAGVSPIKLHSLPKRRKISVAKEKLERLVQNNTAKAAKVIRVDVLQMLPQQDPEISVTKSISFHKVTKEQMVPIREQLEKIYKEGSTVPGTCNYHFYEPVPNRDMAVR